MAYMDEHNLKARAAWAYYMDGLDQLAVAQRLGVSRATVSRLLRSARDEGLVTVTVRADMVGSISLEADLRALTGLHDVIVVPTAASYESTQHGLAQGAAWYLDRHLGSVRILGVGWGSTISYIPRYLPRRHTSHPELVTELFGVSDGANPANRSLLRLSLALGQHYGVPVRTVNAPVIVPTVEVAQALRHDPQIRQTYQASMEADLAIVAIGVTHQDSTMVATGHLTLADIEALNRAGAVGDVLARYYNRAGELVPSPFEERVMGLTLTELRHTRRIMAVAGGSAKVEAIVGAVRGCWIDVLVVDEDTATEICARLRAEGPGSGRKSPAEDVGGPTTPP